MFAKASNSLRVNVRAPRKKQAGISSPLVGVFTPHDLVRAPSLSFLSSEVTIDGFGSKHQGDGADGSHLQFTVLVAISRHHHTGGWLQVEHIFYVAPFEISTCGAGPNKEGYKFI